MSKIKDIFPTKLYQRYLASNFITPFAMSLIFFVMFLLTTQLFKFMALVTKKGVSILSFLEILAHMAMSFIPMATPLSILFAMIYTLNKLSEDSEIVALRAMGIDKKKIFAPFFFIALAISIAVVSLNTYIIPTSKKIFRNQFVQLASQGVLTDIKKEKFYTDIPGVILFAEDVDKDGTILTNVFLRITSGKNAHKVIMAKRGVLNKSKANTNNSLKLRFDFFNGSIISLDNNGKEIEKILFDTYEYPIVSNRRGSSVNKASMMGSKELMATIKKYEESLKVEKDQNRVKRVNKDIRKALIEYWGRYATPVQCIIFALLGFVFGVKKGRGATKNTTSTAFIVTIIYYSLYFSGISLIKKTSVPVPIILFLPSVITGLIGIRYYKNLDWNS